MLATLPEVLAAHRERGTAAGAFTCYGMEGAAGVLRAAERYASPGVILLISPQAFDSDLGDALLSTLLALAAASSVPTCVQLDHAPSLDLIERALAAGANAVLADGSRLPYEENVELARRAVELAAARGAHVEVELGHIAGDEEAAAAARAESMTDPEQAADLMDRSGAACLAVSIGNVHGHYAEEPELDLGRLARVRERVGRPLALHGASGLPEPLVRAAIEGGVVKINVNTELRAAFIGAFEHELPTAREGLRLLALGLAASTAVTASVLAKLELFERSRPGGSS